MRKLNKPNIGFDVSQFWHFRFDSFRLNRKFVFRWRLIAVNLAHRKRKLFHFSISIRINHANKWNFIAKISLNFSMASFGWSSVLYICVGCGTVDATHVRCASMQTISSGETVYTQQLYKWNEYKRFLDFNGLIHHYDTAAGDTTTIVCAVRVKHDVAAVCVCGTPTLR